MRTDKFGIGLYSPRVAARVAKIRYQNFQAWSKANLLHPTFRMRVGATIENAYSYHDLLLIRLVVRLRQRNFSPKVIKRALDVISDMSGGDPHAWMRSTIYVDGRLIVAQVPGREEWNPVAASRGSQKMAVVFFPELMRELEKELIPDRFRHIEINPEVLAGAPVIKGTRIPTRAVVEVSRGAQDPKVAYPGLTQEQIEDAQAYEEFLEAA